MGLMSYDDLMQERLIPGPSVSDSISVRNRRMCYVTVVAMCIIGLAVIIIAALGTFVIIPRIIQTEMQGAEIQARHISISNPTSYDFTIMIDVMLNISGSYVVYAERTAVELMYGHSVITEIFMDGMKIDGPVNFLLNNTALIRSQAFDSFTRDLVMKPSVELGFRSTFMLVPVSSLFGNLTHCLVPVNKNLSLTGFGGLKPLVKSFAAHVGDSSSFNFDATFDLDNPTVFSLDPVGVLSFTLFSDSIRIGHAVSASSWSVEPGLNRNFSILGTIAPSTDQEIEKVAEIMRDLANKRNVTLTGVISTPSSSEPIYAKGLANITVDFEISGAAMNQSAI